MVNYIKLAATALRLIEKNGRIVTLVRRSEVPANSNEPWKGAADVAATIGDPDPDLTGKVGIEVSAVFVGQNDAELAELFGAIPLTEVKRGLKVALVAGSDVTPEELSKYDAMIDTGDVWSIDIVDTLRPGPLAMIHRLVLTR